MRGFDGEVGYRVPLFEANDDKQLRVFAGAYRFYAEGVNPVQGPRLRSEFTIDEVTELWRGARLTFGAELQNDGPRGTQGFLTARLRIPLQVLAGGGSGGNAPRLTPMERRMTDPVIRDVDVVSQSGAFGAAETVTQLANGQSFTVFNSGTTSGAGLAAAVAGAGSNVILAGSFSTGTNTVTLNAGQSLMGSGVSVRSPSGRTATLTNSASITATVAAGGGAVDAANNTTISGLTISNTNGTAAGANGVRVNGVSGVTIANNTITASETGANSSNGVLITGGGSATVTGNSISAVANNNAGIATAFNLLNGSATIASNTLSASGSTAANRFLAFANGTTVNAGSTGNTALAGTCLNAGVTGSVSFTNATTCP